MQDKVLNVNFLKNYYFVIDDPRLIKNIKLLELYKKEALNEPNLIISGRLGDYKYYDMHHTIDRALQIFENHFN